MYKIFLLLSITIGIIACSGDTNSGNASTNDLTQLENDWMHAMMKRDRSTLEQLVAQEFTVTGMKYIDSPAVTRNVWMNDVIQKLKVDSVHFLNIKTTTVGDAGVVRGLLYWSGSYGEDRFSDTTSFVDTWLKRTNDWKVISRVVTD
jgi:hypothetical protein